VRTLRRLLVLLLAVVAASTVALTVAPSASAATRNDYPYRYDTTQRADPWGFTKRQCVSFVAWRERQRGHALSNATQRWGSAYNWNNAAARMGVKIGRKPVVGAIAQWNTYERSAYYSPGSSRPNGTVRSGGYGHVGYVRAVYADGSALVENYNLGAPRAYLATRVKAPRYIYYGVRAPR